jgi:hypothetical protein
MEPTAMGPTYAGSTAVESAAATVGAPACIGGVSFARLKDYGTKQQSSGGGPENPSDFPSGSKTGNPSHRPLLPSRLAADLRGCRTRRFALSNCYMWLCGFAGQSILGEN